MQRTNALAPQRTLMNQQNATPKNHLGPDTEKISYSSAESPRGGFDLCNQFAIDQSPSDCGEAFWRLLGDLGFRVIREYMI